MPRTNSNPPPKPFFPDNTPEQILAYLREHLPDYPFHPEMDPPFVSELAEDFPEVDILEEIKTFRWYYDNAPLARVKNVRVALRRWIANAKPAYPSSP